jgi:hypothetical protein
VFDLHSNTSINAFDSSLSLCLESDYTPGLVFDDQNSFCDQDNRNFKQDARDISALNEISLFYETYATTISSEDWRQMDREDILNLALPGDELHLKDGLWNG